MTSAIAFWFGLSVVSSNKALLAWVQVYFSVALSSELNRVHCARGQEAKRCSGRGDYLLHELEKMISSMEQRVNSHTRRVGLEVLICQSKKRAGNKSIKIKRLSVTVYFLLSLCGMAFQLYHISRQYFKFDVKTQVWAELEERIVTPIVSLCFLTEEVTPFGRGQGKTGPTNGSTPNQLMTTTFDNLIYSNVTSSNSKSFLVYSRLPAKSEIKNDKFLRQGRVCYLMDMNSTGVYLNPSRNAFTKARSEKGDLPGVLFEISAISPDVSEFTIEVGKWKMEVGIPIPSSNVFGTGME